MAFVILKLPHKCPSCKSENSSLEHYQIQAGVPYLFPGDFVQSSIAGQSYIRAKGHCNNCNKEYDCKIGCIKSILKNVIIFDKKKIK